MTESDSVRASDSEREAAVERLRSASVEGRLTLGELTTRTEAAYSAQMRGELARITADLPERTSGTALAQRAHSQRIVSVFANVARTGWWRAEGTGCELVTRELVDVPRCPPGPVPESYLRFWQVR